MSALTTGIEAPLTSLLSERFGARFRTHEPMANHTNFRVGGPAQYYVEARTSEEVAFAVHAAREEHVPWFVIGGGSNTLVADVGFHGLIIQVAMRTIAVDGNRVRVGAGAITASVALEVGRAGLSGFEWAISLPGTIGGAVRGNAGCFGGEVKDVVERVHVLDTATMEMRDMDGAACAFHYRHSIFKEHPEWVILEATLSLYGADTVLCRATMDQFLERRRRTQPHDKPSAGCLFKNVELHALSADAMDRIERLSSGAWRGVVHDGQLPAGWVIDQLGMKGRRIGHAQISSTHGNFVLNVGGATAADVLALGEDVRRSARDTLAIDIAYEVQRLGC